MISKGRHEEIVALFHEARRLPVAKRSTFLEARCREDAALREEVEALLEQVEDASQFFDGVADRAAAIVKDVPATAGSDGLPDAIGPYKITGVIGEGGMGRVFEGEQGRPQRRVALKVLQPGKLSAEVRRRFEYEAEILAHLQHPGIVQVYELGEEELGFGRQPYIAMELVEGASLTEYLRDHPLTHSQRIELHLRICDAVQHAHGRGVLHRDLKPDNILVDHDGSPRILDFGIARVRGTPLDRGATQTQTGQLMGTLDYMSPEQASAEPEAIDTRSDVYSLGVILFEMLTGKRPLELGGLPIDEAVAAIREKAPTRLTMLDSTLKGDLETVVGKALAKEGQDRYATVSALADDLRRYLADEPVLARAPTTFYVLRKFIGRNKAGVGLVSLVLLVAITGAALGYYRWQDGRRQTAEAAVRAFRLGEAYLAEAHRSTDPVKRKRAVLSYRTSAELEPTRSATWMRLAEAALRADDGEQAKLALDRARLLGERGWYAWDLETRIRDPKAPLPVKKMTEWLTESQGWSAIDLLGLAERLRTAGQFRTATAILLDPLVEQSFPYARSLLLATCLHQVATHRPRENLFLPLPDGSKVPAEDWPEGALALSTSLASSLAIQHYGVVLDQVPEVAGIVRHNRALLIRDSRFAWERRFGGINLVDEFERAWREHKEPDGRGYWIAALYMDGQRKRALDEIRACTDEELQAFDINARVNATLCAVHLGEVEEALRLARFFDFEGWRPQPGPFSRILDLHAHLVQTGKIESMKRELWELFERVRGELSAEDAETAAKMLEAAPEAAPKQAE